jgi:hypothetical protein
MSDRMSVLQTISILGWCAVLPSDIGCPPNCRRCWCGQSRSIPEAGERRLGGVFGVAKNSAIPTTLILEPVPSWMHRPPLCLLLKGKIYRKPHLQP